MKKFVSFPPGNRREPKDYNMKKEVDFSNSIRGKHAPVNLEIIGAVENLWAICVTHADKNFIPLKLYKIEISAKDKIKVKNENGETVFCPKTWFAPLDVSSKMLGLIEKTA